MEISEDNRLYGMTFRDLGCNDQRRLAREVLRTAIVSGGRAGGMDMHEMFERLHTADGPTGSQDARIFLLVGGLGDAHREMNRDKD